VSQVVNSLVRAGWVRSDQGPTGGYSLTVDLVDVSVLAVIEAVEGSTESGRWVLADRPCDESAHCAIHVPWQRARSSMLRELAAVSVADQSISVNREPSL
jgi:Rrf2 family protein